MRTGWRWLLVFSLLLNCLFIGFGGAVAWRLRHGAIWLAEAAVIRPLDAQDKLIMRQHFRAAAPQAAAAAAQMRAAHLAMDAALRAEPFDPVALTQAFDAWRNAESRFLASFEPAFVQGATAISPAGRRAMADLGDRQVARAARAAGNFGN